MTYRFRTPQDAADAKRRYEVKRKQYEKLIHDVASGDNEREDVQKLNEKKVRVRDEMGDLVRFMSDDSAERDRLFEKLSALGRRWEEAQEKGYHARQARREKDIVRLRQEHRASLPDPYSHEGELMRSRGRY